MYLLTYNQLNLFFFANVLKSILSILSFKILTSNITHVDVSGYATKTNFK